MRTQFSKVHYFNAYEVDESTQTVPDQTLGIRELLERHTRGVPLGVNTVQGEYFDTEIPRFDDLTDMLEYKKQLMERNKELNRMIREERDKVKVEPQPDEVQTVDSKKEVDE